MDLFRIAAEWKRPLQTVSLADFSALWALPRDWVEEPNLRRGGWSGVTRMALTGDDGVEHVAYLKRQDGQFRRTLSSRGRARPTYFHEFVSLVRLRALGVPVVEWVCYGERAGASLLVTLAPEGFISLTDLAERGDVRLLDAALKAVVQALGALHRHRWQHGSCYPAHVLIHPETLAVRFLDLERSRRHWSVASATAADLHQLIRRCEAFLDPGRVDAMVQVAQWHAPRLSSDSLPLLNARSLKESENHG